MAKKTKTLADVQTVTTVNDDQLIPITDASGNVVKVSMANLRAALIGNLQFSSINIVDGGESVMVAAQADNNEYFYGLIIPFDIENYDYLSLHIGNIVDVNNKGIERVQIAIYTNDLSSIFAIEYVNIGKGRTITFCKNKLFKTNGQNSRLLLYPGISGYTAGNVVRFDNVMLTSGNMPCLTWAPSINDQKQNAIDGVKVGGVNMLDDSETMKSWSIQHASRQSYQGYDCAVATGDVHSQCGVYLYKDKMPTLEVGKEYVSSVWVFAEQVSTLQIGLEANSIGFYYRLSEDEVGKWIRVSLLQKSTDPSTSFVCYADIKDPSHKVAFRMAQLEEGNKETTWSRSYNDLKAQFAPAVLSSESE